MARNLWASEQFDIIFYKSTRVRMESLLVLVHLDLHSVYLK